MISHTITHRKIAQTSLVGMLLVAVFCVTAAVRADLVYNLTESKDPAVADLLEGFAFTLSEIDEGAGARLTLNITEYGIANEFLDGKDGIKFKDFGFSDSKIFNYSGGWSFNGWTEAIDVAPYYQGTYVDLSFANGMDWATFVADHAEEFEIYAHMQSINGSNFDLSTSASINRSVYTYYDSEPETPGIPTPEPATLAILGLGLTGLGLTLRRKR